MADTFTDLEKYEQAWGNSASIIATTHEFLKKRGIDPADLTQFLGETFVSSWQEARGDLVKAARFVALNMTSVGCTTETTHEDGKATVNATWSPELDEPAWPVPPKPALVATSAVYEPIMSWLGVDFSWEETSNGIVFRLG